MTPGKHNRNKQRCQDFCWKVNDRNHVWSCIWNCSYIHVIAYHPMFRRCKLQWDPNITRSLVYRTIFFSPTKVIDNYKMYWTEPRYGKPLLWGTQFPDRWHFLVNVQLTEKWWIRTNDDVAIFLEKDKFVMSTTYTSIKFISLNCLALNITRQ